MTNYEDISIEDLVNERFRKSRCPKQTNDEEKALDEVAEEATAAVNYSIDAKNAESEHAKEVFEDIKNEEIVHMGENLEVASKENPEVKEKVMEGVEEASDDKIEKSADGYGGSNGNRSTVDMTTDERKKNDVITDSFSKYSGFRTKRRGDDNNAKYNIAYNYRDNGNRVGNLIGNGGAIEANPVDEYKLITRPTKFSRDPELFDLLRMTVVEYNHALDNGADRNDALDIFRDRLAKISNAYLNGQFKYKQPSKNIIDAVKGTEYDYFTANGLPRLYTGSDYNKKLVDGAEVPSIHVTPEMIAAEKDPGKRKELEDINAYQSALRNRFMGLDPNGYALAEDNFKNNAYRTEFNEEHDRQTSAFWDILELLRRNYKRFNGYDDDVDFRYDDAYKDIKAMLSSTNKTLGKIRQLGAYRDIYNMITDENGKMHPEFLAYNTDDDLKQYMYDAWKPFGLEKEDFDLYSSALAKSGLKFENGTDEFIVSRALLNDMSKSPEKYDGQEVAAAKKIAQIYPAVKGGFDKLASGGAAYMIGDNIIKVGEGVDEAAKYMLNTVSNPIITKGNNEQARDMTAYIADLMRAENGIEPMGRWKTSGLYDLPESVDTNIEDIKLMKEYLKEHPASDPEFGETLGKLASTGHARTEGHDSASTNSFWHGDDFQGYMKEMSDALGGYDDTSAPFDEDEYNRTFWNYKANKEMSAYDQNKEEEQGDSQEMSWAEKKRADKLGDMRTGGWLAADDLRKRIGDTDFINFTGLPKAELFDESGHTIQGLFNDKGDFVGDRLPPGQRVRISNHLSPKLVASQVKSYNDAIANNDTEAIDSLRSILKDSFTVTPSVNDVMDYYTDYFTNVDESLPAGTEGSIEDRYNKLRHLRNYANKIDMTGRYYSMIEPLTQGMSKKDLDMYVKVPKTAIDINTNMRVPMTDDNGNVITGKASSKVLGERMDELEKYMADHNGSVDGFDINKWKYTPIAPKQKIYDGAVAETEVPEEEKKELDEAEAVKNSQESIEDMVERMSRKRH